MLEDKQLNKERPLETVSRLLSGSETQVGKRNAQMKIAS